MSTMKGDDRLKDVEWPSPTGTCPVILSEAKNLYAEGDLMFSRNTNSKLLQKTFVVQKHQSYHAQAASSPKHVLCRKQRGEAEKPLCLRCIIYSY